MEPLWEKVYKMIKLSIQTLVIVILFSSTIKSNESYIFWYKSKYSSKSLSFDLIVLENKITITKVLIDNLIILYTFSQSGSI